MPEGRRRPEVAHLEDCDSDESSVRPGTRVEARKQVPSTKSLKIVERQQRPGPPDAASDSGYSSHASGNVIGSGLMPSQVMPSSQPAISTRSRPTIHQSGSQQRAPQQLPTRSASVSRAQTSHCNDPNCRDNSCMSSRNPERRYTLHTQPQPQPQPSHQHQRQQSVPTQYPVQTPTNHYQQAPPYQYGQQYGAQPIPTTTGQPPAPRPRASSSARARPTSWANGAYNLPPGYPYGSTPPQGPYASPAHGPPPSQSAYQSMQQPDYALFHQQQALAALQLGSTPPTNVMGAYPPPSPGGVIAPTPNAVPQQNRHSIDFSTRRVSTSYQNHERPAVPITQAYNGTSQRYSARSLMPGSFPGEVVVSDEGSMSDSGSSSCSSYSGDSDYDRRRRRRDRAPRHAPGRQVQHIHDARRKSREIEYVRDRDRELMPPPQMMPRRPSLKSAKTTPAVSHHSSREPLHRAARSDSGPEYISSDNMDSDRTARPVVGRRTTHSSSTSRRSSRGPSIFSSSSGRTPGTEYSSEPKSNRYIVEDPYGNRRAYYSREEAESTARRLQQKQQRLEDNILAYQRDMSGSMSPELTLDNIKRSQQKTSKPSSSHVSGSSKKSGSSKLSKTDTSFQIKTGDTVFQVNGDAKIEVRQNEEGGQVFTIGSASGRENKYYTSSSRSSGSRVGRSRHGSDLGRRRDTIHEDPYEPGY